MIFKALFGRKDKDAAEVGGTKDLLTLSRKLPVSADRGFAAFVDELDRWWPRERTWGKDKIVAVGIEPRYGGRCFEKAKDGTLAVWGTVLAFDRPNHIVFSWQISPSGTPEASEASSSRVDIRFAPETPETCTILVVHRDFFRHGDGWEKYRQDMAAKNGWPAIVDLYAKALA